MNQSKLSSLCQVYFTDLDVLDEIQRSFRGFHPVLMRCHLEHAPFVVLGSCSEMSLRAAKGFQQVYSKLSDIVVPLLSSSLIV